jgi:hypothetical protein
MNNTELLKPFVSPFTGERWTEKQHLEYVNFEKQREEEDR